jgi:hypothetical protein
MSLSPSSATPSEIAQRVFSVRGQRVLLDSDLATLYGVELRRLNEQVRRNRARFPEDFAFQIAIKELRNLKSQIATSSWGGRRKPPIVFTEHGAIMAATVLNSPRAVGMSVYVVRAFVKLREVLASNADLAHKLEALEKSVASLDRDTRRQFAEVHQAVRALMTPTVVPPRPVGFTANIGRRRDGAR